MKQVAVAAVVVVGILAVVTTLAVAVAAAVFLPQARKLLAVLWAAPWSTMPKAASWPWPLTAISKLQFLLLEIICERGKTKHVSYEHDKTSIR